MAKKTEQTNGCNVCGRGFLDRDLAKVPLQQPACDARICKDCRARVQELEDPAGSAGKRLRLRVAVAGVDRGDLELALEEALRYVREGCLSGHDQNDTGAYVFNVEEKG
jgi:hypothetical protein